MKQQMRKVIRRYIVTTTKKLFSNDIIKFIHNNSYIINELLNTKESQEIDRFLDKIAGKGELSEEDRLMVSEFNRYLKYRIILNKDFKFKDNDTNQDFTYELKKQNDQNEDIVNPMFGDEEILSLLNNFPHVEKINIVNELLGKLNSLNSDLNLVGTFNRIQKIVKLNNDKDILDSLNAQSGDGFLLHNLKYSVRTGYNHT